MFQSFDIFTSNIVVDIKYDKYLCYSVHHRLFCAMN